MSPLRWFKPRIVQLIFKGNKKYAVTNRGAVYEWSEFLDAWQELIAPDTPFVGPGRKERMYARANHKSSSNS